MKKVGMFASDRGHKTITLATLLMTLIALAPAAGLKAQEIPARGRGPSTGRATNSAASDSGAQSAARGYSGLGLSRIFPIVGEGPTCDFDATIYEVRAPAIQIGRLDLDALTRAAVTADAFEKTLALLGTYRSLYRANQSVRLASDSISISADIPYVAATVITSQGNTANSVGYVKVGALFNIVGNVTADKIELDLNAAVTTHAESTAEITANVKAPMFREVNMAHKGPIEPRQPFVLVSMDAASADPAGNAVGYIARITLGTPAPAR